MALKLEKNKITFYQSPNSIKRSKAVPLDYYSLFDSLTEAEKYAQSNTAYVGQTLVVANNDEVKQYIIVDTKGTLQPVGGGTTRKIKVEKNKGIIIPLKPNTSKINITFNGRVVDNKYAQFVFDLVEGEMVREFSLGSDEYQYFQGDVEITIDYDTFKIKYDFGNEYITHNKESGSSLMAQYDGNEITEIYFGLTENIDGAFIIEETFSN